jgi:hypothetical protein
MQIAQKKEEVNPPMLVFNVDGTIDHKTLTKDPTVEEIQALLHGAFEIADQDLVYYYLIDEEGLLKDLPQNPRYKDWVGTVIAIPRRWFH